MEELLELVKENNKILKSIIDRFLIGEEMAELAKEELQEVHDETKQEVKGGVCQVCGKELDQDWKTYCAYHYAKMMEAQGK